MKIYFICLETGEETKIIHDSFFKSREGAERMMDYLKTIYEPRGKLVISCSEIDHKAVALKD